MEEELTEECLKAMWEDERQHERNTNSIAWSTATSMPENGAELCQQLNNLKMHDDLAKQVYLNLSFNKNLITYKYCIDKEYHTILYIYRISYR